MTDAHTPSRRGPGRPPRETADDRTRATVEDRPADIEESRRSRYLAKSSDPSLRRFGLSDDILDLDRYVYRSAEDQGRRLLDLTENDDYDFVSDKGNQLSKKDSEGVARFQSGTNVDGSPLYTYLLRKRRDFAEAHARDKEARIAATESARAEPDDMKGEQSYTPKR